MLLLLLTLITLFISCTPSITPPEETVDSPIDDLASSMEAPAPPHYKFSMPQWQAMDKELVGLDSLQALKFLLLEVNKDYLEDCRKIQMTQLDMNQNGQEELFVVFDREYTVLYQKDQQGQWLERWDIREDGHGPASLLQSPNTWIEFSYYAPCSHCGLSPTHYYQLQDTTVIHLFSLMSSYDFDHEWTDSDTFMFEMAYAEETFTDSTLHVMYHLELSLNGLTPAFLKDSIQVVYTWNTPFDGLQVQATSPTALRPHLLKKMKRGQKRHDSYHNRAVSLAYWDYYTPTLLQLQQQPTYQAVIAKVEQLYEEPWKNIVRHWPKKYSTLMTYPD